MIKCPKCEKDINTLSYELVEKETAEYNIDDDEYYDDELTTVSEGYKCPECSEVVFIKETEMLEYIEAHNKEQ